MTINPDLIESTRVNFLLYIYTYILFIVRQLQDLTSAYCIIAQLMGSHIQYDIARAEKETRGIAREAYFKNKESLADPNSYFTRNDME